jgi:enamine deaminase RidA (YjgF/YER057c/UK114 family)
MLRCITLRLALPVVLAATLLPAAALAQSQDSQSVAEAARRAREQKKPQPKPSKVITDEDLKPATAANPSAPGSPASTDGTTASGASAATASSTTSAVTAPPAGSAPTPDAKDQKDSKEVADLKAQIKQAMADLDLALREKTLENDKYYSNSDYAHDTAGKTKLDELIQQVADRQQELEALKARLEKLLPPQDASATAPPKP